MTWIGGALDSPDEQWPIWSSCGDCGRIPDPEDVDVDDPACPYCGGRIVEFDRAPEAEPPWTDHVDYLDWLDERHGVPA